MKKISLLFSVIIFIAVLETNAQDKVATGIHFENTTWSEILNIAKTEKKLIFLDAYASWCGPCKMMAKNVFTDEEVANHYNKNFINAKIDMEKGEGIELAKKYDVRNYPTFLFIDSEGNILHQACGAKETSAFIQLGKDAFEDHKTTSAYLKKTINDGVDGMFMMDYVKVLSDACISAEAPLQNYFNSLSEKESIIEPNLSLIIEYVKDYNNPGFQALVKYQKPIIEKIASQDGEDVAIKRINGKINDVYGYNLKKAARDNEKIEFDKVQRQIKASNLTTKDELLLKGDLHWSRYQKDWNKYVDLTNQYVPKYAMENYKELNSIAWTYYENVDDKHALSIASEWIQVSLDLHEGYSNQDTYAALLYKLGKKDEAANAATKAIELAQKEGIDAEDTVKLLEKIQALN